MALIKKTVLACNKCGKEAETAANVTILNEEFYLCDDCLERLIRWVTTPSEPAYEPEQTIGVTNGEGAQETKNVFDENGVPKETQHRSHAPISKTNFLWDDYYIDKLLTLREQGNSYEACAKSLGTTCASIMNVLHRIREAEVGHPRYPHKARLLALGRIRGSRNNENQWKGEVY